MERNNIGTKQQHSSVQQTTGRQMSKCDSYSLYLNCGDVDGSHTKPNGPVRVRLSPPQTPNVSKINLYVHAHSST